MTTAAKQGSASATMVMRRRPDQQTSVFSRTGSDFDAVIGIARLP